jgi:uroporphyrinogen III methyltransferase/synthase
LRSTGLRVWPLVCGPAVAAVGTQTAKALAARGVPVAMVPDDQRQEGLVAGFGALAAGTRVLFPQALGGRELLREALAQAGAVVDVVPVSETAPLALESPPPPFDVATFASPSALRAFVAACSVSALSNKVVAVIGPTTQEAARALGVAVDVVARTPSVAALVEALCAYRRPS